MRELAQIDASATALTRHRYDRIAPLYDAGEWFTELGARRWRHELWSRVGSGRILELGVGTGKNIRFYPAGREIVAVDLSERMLARAREKAARLGATVQLELGDAQHLAYPDRSFDVVVASFVFCSVPDPLTALTEVRRVLRPGGQLLLLEHVLSRRPLLRRWMRWVDPLPFRIWGAHIDRETTECVRSAGFAAFKEVNLFLDVVKLITARAP